MAVRHVPSVVPLPKFEFITEQLITRSPKTLGNRDLSGTLLQKLERSFKKKKGPYVYNAASMVPEFLGGPTFPSPAKVPPIKRFQ